LGKESQLGADSVHRLQQAFWNLLRTDVSRRCRECLSKP
jgi:hypothetical protein